MGNIPSGLSGYKLTSTQRRRINLVHACVSTEESQLDQQLRSLPVSCVCRLVHLQLLPTPLSCCHVAMATWEGPAFTTPGSQRRSSVWGEGCIRWMCRQYSPHHKPKLRTLPLVFPCSWWWRWWWRPNFILDFHLTAISLFTAIKSMRKRRKQTVIIIIIINYTQNKVLCNKIR